MLEEVRGDDNWITAPLEGPRGRGINFEITVRAVEPLLERRPPQAGLCIGNSRSAGTAAMRLKSACASSRSRIRTAICCDSRSGSANGRLTGRPASGHGKPAACLKTAGPDLSPPQAPSEALRQRLGGIAGRLALIDRVGQFRDEPGQHQLGAAIRQPDAQAFPRGGRRAPARASSVRTTTGLACPGNLGRDGAAETAAVAQSKAATARVCIRCKVGMMGILCKREKSVAAAALPRAPAMTERIVRPAPAHLCGRLVFICEDLWGAAASARRRLFQAWAWHCPARGPEPPCGPSNTPIKPVPIINTEAIVRAWTRSALLHCLSLFLFVLGLNLATTASAALPARWALTGASAENRSTTRN